MPSPHSALDTRADSINLHCCSSSRYTGPIAPPSQRLKLLPEEAPARSQKKAVAYEDDLSGGWDPSVLSEYRNRAFSTASGLGGGIGESPVHVRQNSHGVRREGSSGSSESTGGRPSFSRTAKEFFPFIAASRSERTNYDATRSPGLSSISTPSTSDSSSEFADPLHHVEPSRRRSRSTSHVNDQSPMPYWEPVPLLIRSKSRTKAAHSRKISEPFLTPAEPALNYIPSRPVPAPSTAPSPSPNYLSPKPQQTLGVPRSDGRSLSPYLRTKPLPQSVSTPNLHFETLPPVPPPRVERSHRKQTSYEVSTFCDTFVYPQPKIKPFLISPPPTPQSLDSATFDSQPLPTSVSNRPKQEPPTVFSVPGRSSLDRRFSVETIVPLEERVRKEGEAREYERAAWARAAKHVNSLGKTFDAKWTNRRRTKSMTHVHDFEARRTFRDPQALDSDGPQPQPIDRPTPSPDIATSFDFLKLSHARNTSKGGRLDEYARESADAQGSPLRAALRKLRKSSSLGNISLVPSSDQETSPPQVPRVNFESSARPPSHPTYAGRTPPPSLSLLPTDDDVSSPTGGFSGFAGHTGGALGSVVDIGFDDADANVWKAVHPTESSLITSPRELEDEIGLAVSPTMDDFGSRPSSGATDRFRVPSRTGSVSSVQAFHRRFPSSSSARPSSDPPREAWRKHSVGQSLDSSVPATEMTWDDLLARQRMSKPPSNRLRPTGDVPYSSFGASLTSAPARLSAFTVRESEDKYTTIPVIRPLSRSSDSPRSSRQGLQSSWEFPARSRQTSGASSSARLSAGSGGSTIGSRRSSLQALADERTPVSTSTQFGVRCLFFSLDQGSSVTDVLLVLA